MKPIFVALDNDRLTNASTDLSTKPLSTWLENRVHANNKCLVSNSHCVATSKPNGLSTRYTNRYYASLIPTCIHVGVYDVVGNTSNINVSVLGTAQNGLVEIWAELYVFRGGALSTVIHRSTPIVFSSGDLAANFEMDIDPKELTTSKCIVAIWMRSEGWSAPLQTRNRGQILWTEPDTTTHDGFREQSTVWDNFDLDHIIEDSDSGRVWQIINNWTVSGKGGALDGLWHGIQPLDGKRIELTAANANNTFYKRQIPRFNHYSTYVSFERNPDRSTFFYSAKDESTMRAQVPVLGQHVSQHAINLDTEHEVYRMQHVGLETLTYQGVYWQNEGKKQWWPVRQGGTGPGAYDLKNSVGVDIDWGTTSKVEVSGLLMGVELNALWTGENDKVGYPPAPNTIERFEATGRDDPRRFAAPQANDSVQRVKGILPVRIKMRQLATGDPDIFLTSYEEDFDFEVEMTYWRTTPDYSRPLLRALSFGYHGDVFTNGRSGIRSQTNVPQGYYHTEGCLQELNGHNDLAYLTPFTFTIDPPAGFDSTKPTIFQILIGYTDKTSYYSTVSEPVSLGFDADGLAKFEDTRMFSHLVTWSVATRGVLDV